jgi:hypothetical protein
MSQRDNLLQQHGSCMESIRRRRKLWQFEFRLERLRGKKHVEKNGLKITVGGKISLPALWFILEPYPEE